jgi:nicotinate-nucleotide pyrophosphorylase (carboxylating)
LPADLPEQVRRALAEDVGTGDLTAALLPKDAWSWGRVVSREPAVVCGGPWFDAVFAELDPRIQIRWRVAEGAEVDADAELCTLDGPSQPLLTGERTALNFLQTLSGTATTTRKYARVLAGSRTTLLDTRKTLPGLRTAQKYAVRCGGGSNHRMGLYDGILIKENHIIALGSIAQAVAEARRLHPGVPVEVEVETLAEVDEAVAAGADTLLLDNFTPATLGTAVARVAGEARLEISGGMGREGLIAAAALGVDYVSMGALTKHVRAIDLSLRFTHGKGGTRPA